jgi:hypothetical protein
MTDPISRRAFTSATAGAVLGSAAVAAGAEQPPAQAPTAEAKPTEAPFERDYPPPGFKPSWKKQQLSRLFVQDFVIFAHSDLAMTRKLLEKNPAIVNATMDWGAGDWETGLGGASHMGRLDIVELLLAHGARIDIFCAAVMGQLDAVRAFLTQEPKLIDAKGPHGFSLHFHAQVGATRSENVLAYLQSVKHVDLKPNPFLQKPAGPATKKTGQ